MATRDGLSELRGLLYQEPSERGWRALCRLMDKWPQPGTMDVGVDYACEHLQQWPDKLRRLPSGWLKAALAGTPHPASKIARAIEGGRSIAPSLDALLGLAESIGATRLIFKGAKLNPQSVAKLASAKLPDMDVLSLTDADLRAPGGKALAKAPWLAGLSALNLSRNALRDKAIELLCKPGVLGDLRYLNLSHNTLRSTASRSLAKAPWIEHLETFIFESGHKGRSGYNEVVGEGARFLFRVCRAADLEALGLAHQRLHEEAPRIIGLRNLKRLTYLNLRNTQLRPGFGEALADATHLARLEELRLGHNSLRDESVAPLAKATHLRNLRILSLDSNQLTDTGVLRLTRTPQITRLTTLDLAHNTLGRAGIVAILEGPWENTLTSLRLAGAGLMDDDVAPFEAATHMRALRTLDLDRNHVTGRALKRIRDALPKVQVRWRSDPPNTPEWFR